MLLSLIYFIKHVIAKSVVGALRWAGRTRIHEHAHISDGYLKKRASDRSLNAVVER